MSATEWTQLEIVSDEEFARWEAQRDANSPRHRRTRHWIDQVLDAVRQSGLPVVNPAVGDGAVGSLCPVCRVRGDKVGMRIAFTADAAAFACLAGCDETSITAVLGLGGVA